MRPVRSSVKAVVILDGSLLVVSNMDENGPWYMLPGGGQDPGETLHEALQRECQEEIGTPVEIGELRYVRDYIGRHHEFAATSAHFHQIEMMFVCRLPNGYSPTPGHLPDAMQTGVRWIKLTELPGCRFYPKALISRLVGTNEDTHTAVYLGDVN
jgi:8-oxo-dGTP diphosphatase